MNNNGAANTRLAMGYGYTAKNKDDSYAMLLTIRQATLPPILHWKTRLPEGHLTAGILVSPCGHFAIGGGNTGNLYVWTTLGGHLLRVVKAHYRPVQHMAWTTTTETTTTAATNAKASFLATGGADGMVHVFDLVDLVEDASTSDTNSSPSAIRTWSQHHLPITGLVALSDHRLASASSDGKILILHVPSQKVMVTLQMPRKVSALLADSHNTLYVGSTQGIISIIRLDEYAMHQLSQQQGMSVHNTTTAMRAVDQVLGEPVAGSKDSSSASTARGIQYQTELKGHDRPISSLALLDNNNFEDGGGKSGPSLCSGDESGCLRVWDLRSGICLHVTRPWSTTLHNTDNKSTAHPISSIFVLAQSDEVGDNMPGMLDQTSSSLTSSHKASTMASLVPLVTPLQKFRSGETNGQRLLPVWNPVGGDETAVKNNVEASHNMLLRRYRQRREERKKRQKTSDSNEAAALSDSQDARIAALEQQLQEAKEKIHRWETVNNKLMAQLQQK